MNTLRRASLPLCAVALLALTATAQQRPGEGRRARPGRGEFGPPRLPLIAELDLSYTCPQSCDVDLPYSALYGVPAVAHWTTVPSPMSQVIRRTSAVAVTVIPPALAEAVIGPTEWLSALAAHIQTGIPTTPMLPSPGSGVMPMSIARRFICSTAISATSRGVGPAPEFGGGSGAQMRISWLVCGW